MADPTKKIGLSREQSSKALGLVTHLEKQHDAAEFLKPVDFKALGLDDYPLIIKHPMDLSTVKRKLRSSKYSSLAEVFADINLIWENCRTYNQKDSVPLT